MGCLRGSQVPLLKAGNTKHSHVEHGGLVCPFAGTCLENFGRLSLEIAVEQFHEMVTMQNLETLFHNIKRSKLYVSVKTRFWNDAVSF